MTDTTHAAAIDQIYRDRGWLDPDAAKELTATLAVRTGQLNSARNYADEAYHLGWESSRREALHQHPAAFAGLRRAERPGGDIDLDRLRTFLLKHAGSKGLADGNAVTTAINLIGTLTQQRDLAEERLDGEAWERIQAEQARLVCERDDARAAERKAVAEYGRALARIAAAQRLLSDAITQSSPSEPQS